MDNAGENESQQQSLRKRSSISQTKLIVSGTSASEVT
jgi:hypothetical protein